MRWPAVLLATRAAAQFGVFSGDDATDCFYVYNGVNYVSGHWAGPRPSTTSAS